MLRKILDPAQGFVLRKVSILDVGVVLAPNDKRFLCGAQRSANLKV